MMYWVFTDEQLQAALAAYAQRIGEPGVEPAAVTGIVNEFLRSPEAVEHKLQGGAAYEPASDVGGA